MDYDTLVVKESPGLCRCCLSEGCYKDLGTEYQWMNDTEVYADMLFECFDISITQHNEGPNGPNRLICEVCITRLRDACNFKKQVLESEKRFIDMIGRREFKPQMLIYQAQIKHEEKLEELPEEEVEYLEDDVTLQFDEDDQKNAIDLDEPLVSEDITVSSLPVKGKRGRSKKATKAKSEKVEKAKVPRMEEKKPAKMKESSEDEKSDIAEEDFWGDEPKKRRGLMGKQKGHLLELVTVILKNSNVMPFKWFSNNFVCLFCGSEFRLSSKLKTHYSEEHTGAIAKNVLRHEVSRRRIKVDISDLTCKICYKQIKNLEDFLTHASKLHNLEFNRAAAKDIYAFALTDDNLSPCTVCGKQFKFFGSLLKHIYKCQHKTIPYLCEICAQGFAERGALEKHKSAIHLTDQGRCYKCRKIFPDTATLKMHLKQAHKIKCPKCPEVFTTQYQKRAHLIVAHDDKELQFSCDLCSRCFNTKNKLVHHKSNIHFKERNETCEICGFKVYNRRALKLHMVRHNNSRPFQCEICEKTFPRKYSLEMHRRIHLNDKRFACKDCGKAFVQYASLKLHLKVHTLS